MFPVTITINNPADLHKVIAALQISEQHAAVDETAGIMPEPAGKGPGTSAKQPAQGARSQRTAGAAEAAAPASSTGKQEPQSSTKPVAASPAAASSASDTIDYATLQAAVLKLHKADQTAAKPIAEAMGFENFKSIPAERWGEALAKVQARIAEMEVA